MTEAVATEPAVQIIGASFDVRMNRATTIDTVVEWLPFGRREGPVRSAQLRIGGVSLSIPHGRVSGLFISEPLLRSKIFASIEGRDPPSEGRVVVSGSVSSSAELRDALPQQATVSDALLAGLRFGVDSDNAKRRLEPTFLFAGMLKLAYVKIRDLSDMDRAKLAVAICLFREADIFLLDELSLIFDDATLLKICSRASLLAASGKTVILASGNQEWLGANCDEVAAIQSGVPNPKFAAR